MAIQPVTMDKISSVTPAPTVSNSSVASDTKNIQNQIASKQQNLKKVSSDNSITATEKEEKRRQLQKEIDELNRKLEQKKLEQEEKAKEAAKKQEQAIALKAQMHKTDTSKTKIEKEDSVKSAETTPSQDIEKNEEKEKQTRSDMSIKDIQKMLSVDYTLKQEMVQDQVDTKRESTVNVLDAEIQQDKIYGTDTSKKEAELEALQNKETFWSDATKQTNNQEKQTAEQVHAQTVMNQNAKVVIDQI